VIVVIVFRREDNNGCCVLLFFTDKQDPSRFLGEGLTFKGKLIGVLEVSGPRGDRICQEALSELKIAVKAAGEHKQKITIHIALDGLRIRDEKTGV
jgi:disabled family protein 2